MAAALGTESIGDSEVLITQRTKLSLATDHLSSSSPFPSPSSSFLPPPLPGSHEFAMAPAPQGRTKRSSLLGNKRRTSQSVPNGAPCEPIPQSTVTESINDKPTIPTLANQAPSIQTTAPVEDTTSTSTTAVEAKSPGDLTAGPATSPLYPSPSTPTPIKLPSLSELTAPVLLSPSASSTSNQTTPTTSNASAHGNLPPATSNRLSSSSHQSSQPTTPNSPSFHSLRGFASNPRLRDSILSSRPAPPSPDLSRRGSGVGSMSGKRGGSRSRPASAAMSRTNSTRKSTQINPIHITSPGSRTSSLSAFGFGFTSAALSTSRRPKQMVVIKDFAFPENDERHLGLGPDVPKQNRPKRLNRHLRTGSAVSSISSSEGSEDGANADMEEDDGWGGFKFGIGRMSWAPLKMNPPVDETGYVPDGNDFERNFAAEGDDEGEEDDEFDGGYFPLGEEALYPGLYRAIYAFEPEGAAEMALQEEQIVRVIGRGGGVGWAVVQREDGGVGHALVPESYLEVVQLDDEMEGDWEEYDEEEERHIREESGDTATAMS